MTTANPTFAADSGLADRLLLVRMNRRTDETSDASLSDEIREHRNAGLSFFARPLASKDIKLRNVQISSRNAFPKNLPNSKVCTQKKSSYKYL